MKKLAIVLTFCLTLTGVCRAGSALTNIFGNKPKYWVELGGGYATAGTAAKSKVEWTPYWQNLIQLNPGAFDDNRIEDTTPSASGLASVQINFTSKIWVEEEFPFQSAREQAWKYYDSTGKMYDLGTITIKVSPTTSFNYAPFIIYGIKPYGGIAWNEVSVSGRHHVYNGDFPTNIDGGGSNILACVGVKFPIWERLTGSADWRFGKTFNLSTPLVNGGFSLKTTGINTDSFSASLHLALF